MSFDVSNILILFCLHSSESLETGYSCVSGPRSSLLRCFLTPERRSVLVPGENRENCEPPAASRPAAQLEGNNIEFASPSQALRA